MRGQHSPPLLPMRPEGALPLRGRCSAGKLSVYEYPARGRPVMARHGALYPRNHWGRGAGSWLCPGKPLLLLVRGVQGVCKRRGGIASRTRRTGAYITLNVAFGDATQTATLLSLLPASATNRRVSFPPPRVMCAAALRLRPTARVSQPRKRRQAHPPKGDEIICTWRRRT